jgi:hypothetical protein
VASVLQRNEMVRRIAGDDGYIVQPAWSRLIRLQLTS